MSSDCTLSIVIPTYCRPDMLRVCLQSIVDSGSKMLEVVIGDDSGDETTQQVCRDFSEKLPISYLPPPAKGSLPSNLIRLVNAARGTWTLLIHDDDFLVGDHSAYPNSFADCCDFHFTDHWIANETGIIDEKKSSQNSSHYGRTALQEGLQLKVFDIAFYGRVCLDGFYVKSSVAKKILPETAFGPIADYFWVFNLLNSGMRVWYSGNKTFAYRISGVGITASGLPFDYFLKGYRKLAIDYPDYHEIFNKKISYYSWFAVNRCLRQGKKNTALSHLRSIKFRYRHSFKHQILMPIQLVLMFFPVGIISRLKAGFLNDVVKSDF